MNDIVNLKDIPDEIKKPSNKSPKLKDPIHNSTSSQIELNLETINMDTDIDLDKDDEILKNKSKFVIGHDMSLDVSATTGNTNLLNKTQNIFLLTYMYFLQGLPLGLFQSVVLLLSAKHFNYSDLSMFSFVLWPLCFKFLYAPFVNSFYVKVFGKRKTWLCGCYLLIGLSFISTAVYVKDNFLDIDYSSSSSKLRDVTKLTFVFGFIVFVSAWSDIALNGLTLKKFENERNANFLSNLCKNLGLLLGVSTSFQIFLIFESKNLSNKYLRPFLFFVMNYEIDLKEQTAGSLLTIDRYMQILGCIFILSSLYLLIFLSEDNTNPIKNETLEGKATPITLLSSFKTLWAILSIKQMKYVALFFLTFSIGFSIEQIYMIKLNKIGVPIEYLALGSLAFMPIYCLVDILINYFLKTTLLYQFLQLYPCKLVILLMMTLWASFSVLLKRPDHQHQHYQQYAYYFYIVCFLLYVTWSLFNLYFGLLQSNFFAKVSDQKHNSIENNSYYGFFVSISQTGYILSQTCLLKLIGFVNMEYCSFDFLKKTSHNSTESIFKSISFNKCSSREQIKTCASLGGECKILIDSFLWFGILFITIGVIWLIGFRKWTRNIENDKEKDKSVIWTIEKIN